MPADNGVVAEIRQVVGLATLKVQEMFADYKEKKEHELRDR